MNDALLAFSAIGGLSGVATLITAIKTAGQFRNNGGSSARDSLDRIEKSLDLISLEVKANTSRITALAEDADAEHSKLWKAITRTPSRTYHRRKR